MVQLGGMAYGTARQVAKRSMLVDFPAVTTGHDHAEAVVIGAGGIRQTGVAPTGCWVSREGSCMADNGSILVTGAAGQLGAVGRTVTGLLLDDFTPGPLSRPPVRS